MKKVGFALTSSYCTTETILPILALLVKTGYDVIPIMAEGIFTNNTRFGKSAEIINQIETITNKKIISTIVEAEKFGPSEKLDILVIAPATGNTIAKLAHGITDTTVTMAAKATLRNQIPVVIGVSTNDGLGMNGENIFKLYNTKGIYFIPFGQDDHQTKPNSLIAHYELLIKTMEAALENRQIQPLLQPY